MLYAIIARDKEDSLARRLAARADHLARLETLRDDGRLLLAGPHPAIDTPEPGPAGFTGSLIVAEFASLEDAREWAERDPYVEADVYADVTVKTVQEGSFPSMAVDRVQMIRHASDCGTGAQASLKFGMIAPGTRGDPGARSGGGRLFCLCRLRRLHGRTSLLERHRAVYEAMGDAMRSDIHALSIQALTPEEETKP